MTREEKQKRIDILRKLLIEVENIDPDDGGAASCAPPHPRWEPKIGDAYWYIERTGMIDQYDWDNVPVDRNMALAANVFPTENNAAFALERRKVLAEIDEWRGEYGDPVSIAYYENDGKVESIAALYPNRGEAVFANYEDADGCIRAIGQERLKKYYFGIPEDSDVTD